MGQKTSEKDSNVFERSIIFMENTPKRRHRPAQSLEARENQLISRAVDLAEKQLLEGTASSQIISHFLKLGSTREKLEQEKIRRENDFLSAKKESLQTMGRIEELYTKAMAAMSEYKGNTEGDPFD